MLIHYNVINDAYKSFFAKFKVFVCFDFVLVLSKDSSNFLKIFLNQNSFFLLRYIIHKISHMKSVYGLFLIL